MCLNRWRFAVTFSISVSYNPAVRLKEPDETSNKNLVLFAFSFVKRLGHVHKDTLLSHIKSCKDEYRGNS